MKTDGDVQEVRVGVGVGLGTYLNPSKGPALRGRRGRGKQEEKGGISNFHKLSTAYVNAHTMCEPDTRDRAFPYQLVWYP